MRAFSLFVALVLLGGVAVAQESTSHEAVGELAQMMRSIFFTNSNVLFDVQTVDPGASTDPQARGETATQRFGSLYAGWTIVDASAVALAEGANLLLLPGRMCSNGQPAPVDRPDWIQYARQMEEAGRAALEAAKTRDQATVAEITNELVAACTACHSVYRDSPGGIPDRCKVREQRYRD